MARDVLDLSRNQLLVNLRFLDAALGRFVRAEIKGIPLATDGRSLVYDPIHIIRCYQDDRTVPVRDYLHVVLHCVYRHMFVHTLVSHTTWDLACDIAVEYTITGLGLKAAEMKDQVSPQVKQRRMDELQEAAANAAQIFFEVNLSYARQGRTEEVLFEEIIEAPAEAAGIEKGERLLTGYTGNYIRVYVPARERGAEMLGQFAKIRLEAIYCDGVAASVVK